MHLQSNEEQRLLRETLQRFLRDNYPLAVRHAAATRAGGYDPAMWRRFAELGLIGSLFEPRHGGYGGSSFDVAVLFEGLGGALVVEPFLAALLGGGMLAALGRPAQQAVLAPVIAGEALVCLAHAEPQSRYDPADVLTVARRGGDGGWRLDGDKSLVFNGDSATHLVVSARREEGGGIGMFLVPASAPGIELRAYPTVDGSRAANLRLSALQLPADAALGSADEGMPALARVSAMATLAVSAEALGIMLAASEMTLEYLRTRRQFGAPIGSFQALQHRYVELRIEIEQMRSALINAASRLHTDPRDSDWQVCAAKYLAGRVGRLVAEETVQMHGGIGMTWDYPLGHYAKRLVMIDHLFGDTDYHLARCAR